MLKIASPRELVDELRQLVVYCETSSPSRIFLAGALEELAERVALDETAAGRFTFPRESYLPPAIRNKPPLTPEGTDLAIWTWEGEDGLPYGAAFVGRQNKPLWHYRFRSEARRQEEIDKAIESRKSVLKYKQEQQEARRNFKHDYVVGDIICTSWGYDQTNVDAYQVVDIKGKQLLLREISTKGVGDDTYGDKVVPVKDHFIGSELIRVNPGPHGVKVNDHHGSKWDGKPLYQTPFGMGH